MNPTELLSALHTAERLKDTATAAPPAAGRRAWLGTAGALP